MAKRRRQTAADSARARQRKRTTKSKGLVTREKELASAKRELATLRDTGVATKTQLSRAQAEVDSAERALKRQQTTARSTGRPTS